MTIIGNVLCVNMMRTDYLESDPSMGSYMLNNPKEDVDTAKTLAYAALPKSGGSMTGDISMTGNKIAGLAEPDTHTDAATKGYVDSRRKVFKTTLTADGWVGEAAPFIQTIDIADILESDTPHYGPVYSDSTDAALAEKENWMLVDDMETNDGSVTFIAFEEKPIVDIQVQMEVFR